jgi:hypothetical protein
MNIDPRQRQLMSLLALQQQDKVAQAVAECVSEAWLRVVVSYECEVAGEHSVDDTISLYLTEKGGTIAQAYVRLPPEVLAEFIKLRDLVPAGKDGKWNSCLLVIENTGKYKFDFSYDPPKRLNGIFDEDSYDRFSRCAEAYQRELNADNDLHR